ncbi:MAG TPA: glycosyltransferase family 87 protein [Stellaceae bacterium]
MVLAALREASWLTGRRLRDYSTILIAAYAVAALWALTGQGINDPLGRPLGTDFLSFWTVSSALHGDQARAIYSPEGLAALEHAVDPAASGGLFYAWAYPPIALLLVYPLALLPYLWSLAVWLVVGLAAYLAALWRILPGRLTLWAGLAFPAVFICLSHGQNGLLTAALLGWGLLLLPGWPTLAGVLIGVIAFKPQLGIVIPIALAAGGHWRTILAAAATVLVLAAASLAMFGPDAWSDFVASLPFARSMLELGLVPYHKMQSAFAATRLAGGSVPLAYAVQGITTLGAAALVAWVWRRPTRQELKNAILMTAVPLATPFVLDYDLTLLAFPVAWLARSGLRRQALPWERITLAAICLVPLLSRGGALLTHLLVAPLVEAALLLVLAARIHAEELPRVSQPRIDGLPTPST